MIFDVPSNELRKKSDSVPPESPSKDTEKQDEKSAGKRLTARRRLELLFDEGTFEEIGAGVVNRSTDFGLEWGVANVERDR